LQKIYRMGRLAIDTGGLVEQAETVIQSVRSYDARYHLPAGAGSDAVHSESEYCLAVTLLNTNHVLTGTGMVLTLGAGNRIVCEVIELLASALVGKEIERLMSGFGTFSRSLAVHPQLRWLGAAQRSRTSGVGVHHQRLF